MGKAIGVRASHSVFADVLFPMILHFSQLYMLLKSNPVFRSCTLRCYRLLRATCAPLITQKRLIVSHNTWVLWCHDCAKKQQSTLKTSAGDTEWFRIGRGVRQGCVLLPNLFKGGVQIRGEVLNKLGFADDTSLVCNSKKELLGIVHVVRDKSAERDLLLKVKKKIMVVDKDGGGYKSLHHRWGGDRGSLSTSGQQSSKGRSTPEIRTRLAMVREAVQKMANFWRCKGIESQAETTSCSCLPNQYVWKWLLAHV